MFGYIFIKDVVHDYIHYLSLFYICIIDCIGSFKIDLTPSGAHVSDKPSSIRYKWKYGHQGHSLQVDVYEIGFEMTFYDIHEAKAADWDWVPGKG